MSEVGSAIADVEFAGEQIVLHLKDGRALAAPLAWAGSAVVAMNAADRAGWVRTEDGRGVNWPAAGQTSPEGKLNVWALEEDALYEDALAQLKAAAWDVSVLSPRSRALVALWRLVADGNNGGLVQFLGNWGGDEVRVALDALAAVGAARTLGIVREFWRELEPLTEREDVNTPEEFWAATRDSDLSDRLEALDESFWEASPELTRLVARHFGPAPSVR